MARGIGCSTKTIDRAIEELCAKPYIEISFAANQHGRTSIKILKYDTELSGSAVDKYVQSDVQSKPANPQIDQDLQSSTIRSQ
jgi:hypothetical protein